MGFLKLTVEPGDKIEIQQGKDTIIVEAVNIYKNGKVQIGFNAPNHIPIYTIFKDPAKQFKNRQKGL